MLINNEKFREKVSIVSTAKISRNFLHKPYCIFVPLIAFYSIVLY